MASSFSFSLLSLPISLSLSLCVCVCVNVRDVGTVKEMTKEKCCWPVDWFDFWIVYVTLAVVTYSNGMKRTSAGISNISFNSFL